MRDSSSTTLIHDEEAPSVPGDVALTLAALFATVEPEPPRPELRSRLMETIARRRARAA